MGMSMHYQLLFEVRVFHEYYRTGRSADFFIEPTLACAKQLANHGLLFRPSDNGFMVFCQCSLDSVPARSLAGKVAFAFSLVARNPYLLNYSNLPLDCTSSRIYRFHNLNENVAGDDLFLHAEGEYVSAADRIHIKPQFFYHSRGSTQALSQMQLLDKFDDEIARESLVPVEGVVYCPIDVRGFSPGRFTLNMDGKEELVFYGDDDLARKGAFGVVEIFCTSIPDSYRFVRDGKISAKVYTIRIQNRRTRWKYLISAPLKLDESSNTYETGVEPSALSLSCKYRSRNITFKQRDIVTADGKRLIVTFDSDNEMIPLQEETIKGIRLEGTDISVENMPNASVANLAVDKDGKHVSEIFFTI